jgi:aspartate/methionine/tyrosine aminotransferase
VWGLRVGCITFANKGASLESLKALESKAAGVIRKTVSNVSTLSQNLILSSLKSKNNSGEKKNNFNILKERYSVCRKLLDENKKSYSEYFTVLPFNSGYFLCLKLDDSFDCDDVRLKLLNDHSIAVIALPFGNLLRVAFSSVAVANLPIVFEKIVQVCSELQS